MFSLKKSLVKKYINNGTINKNNNKLLPDRKSVGAGAGEEVKIAEQTAKKSSYIRKVIVLQVVKFERYLCGTRDPFTRIWSPFLGQLHSRRHPHRSATPLEPV